MMRWLDACTIVAASIAAIGEASACPEPDRSPAPVGERTPARSMYFDWVSRNWYASNEAKVLADLGFFKWLHDEYGMQLDLFVLDTATIDNGPRCRPVEGRPAYGSLEMESFQREYPHGLGMLSDFAASFGCEIGIWLGPDGFGETEREAQERIELLETLVRDHGVRLFKYDACCSGLRPEKAGYFIEALQRCRAIAPDLIVTNQRVGLPEEAERLVSATLWQGEETYVDATIHNTTTAPHHRAGNLARGWPPGMTRRADDHGVCLSSCMDYWEDDIVLQAFNRSGILSPEIYGNPWLLGDDEFARLARLFNLHRRHRDLLVEGIALPEEACGPFAVARGDGRTRLITLRNLTWEPVTRRIRLDKSLGLDLAERVGLRQYHPTERWLGAFAFGEEIEVEVQPFRACLLKATTIDDGELTIEGCEYRVRRDLTDRPVEIDLLAMPGERASIRLRDGGREYERAILDGEEVMPLVEGESIAVAFPGRPLSQPYHRFLTRLNQCEVPADAEALFEACCFVAGSDALEVRSLRRAGETRYGAVSAARDMLFAFPQFIEQGIWDRFMFDGDRATAFRAWRHDYWPGGKPGVLRIDFSAPIALDELVLAGAPAGYEPRWSRASSDFRSWRALQVEQRGDHLLLAADDAEPIRYVQLDPAPMRVSEAIGTRNGADVPRDRWRASNLLRAYGEKPALHAWRAPIKLDQVAPASYLAVAIPGDYGFNNAFAALRIGDEIRGAPDRAPSYPYNNWEHFGVEDGNYTYYFPLRADDAGAAIEVIVLGFADDMEDIVPEVWITAHPAPFARRRLVLE
jgi:hypothetical protein